jgi:hypothetical protein
MLLRIIKWAERAELIGKMTNAYITLSQTLEVKSHFERPKR